MVAILFARHDSVYKQLPNLDVYDKNRDARTFPGGMPVVAHPPCRAWGRLRHFASPEPGEKDLAKWAVGQVRRWGGVLEHPKASTLWDCMNMPLGGNIDDWGGYTLDVDQFWWGHKARKKTWLYVVGCPQSELPPIPIRLDAITHRIGSMKLKGGRKGLPEITKKEREATPPDLAEWLVFVATLSNRK